MFCLSYLLLDVLSSNAQHVSTRPLLSTTMSDGIHFTEFPPWEAMNFSTSCQVWGEWYVTYLSPSPWNNTRYLDGDVRTIFNLVNSSVPDVWHKPDNWTEGMYQGYVLDWYRFNY
jgi:hypothetical protein